MNPSDTETSDSTSSSSVGPGSVQHAPRRVSGAVRSSLPQHAHGREEEGSPVERVRSSSTPPSYLRETNTCTGGRESRRLEDARLRGRYGAHSEKSLLSKHRNFAVALDVSKVHAAVHSTPHPDVRCGDLPRVCACCDCCGFEVGHHASEKLDRSYLWCVQQKRYLPSHT